ncbi:MAG: formylglycine-generating enzyme family protein [Phycisphaera sp. RhM]|nr:formylglycine-generating enzyme family protein [Phycisphaera sp. RhM]
MPRAFAVIGLSLSAALVSFASPASTDDATPGIATEKPAEGPSVKVDEGYMVPYTFRVPGTDEEVEMIPVPGGEFMFGSPEDEADRRDDEGPQIKVSVDPMWVAKTEVTWGLYQEYMDLYGIFKEFESSGIRVINDDNKVDAITAPTELYDPTFTYEYGEDEDQPAVTMTQYSAQQFTKWLSLVSGQQYRLPTEAEWEYAARGGTTTAYSWGDSADEIDDYAWYFDNADDGQVAVASKKPNPFGLYDVHGNVGEWTVNQYTEDGYAGFADKQGINATELVKWPEVPSPCVVRGGTWESDAEDLRSAARMASDDEEWKSEDPNFPRSPWWHTSDPSRGVGFRIFRSYKPLPKETITKFWEAQAEDTVLDVESRMDGGRGGMGVIDKDLPKAIEAIKK